MHLFNFNPTPDQRSIARTNYANIVMRNEGLNRQLNGDVYACSVNKTLNLNNRDLDQKLARIKRNLVVRTNYIYPKSSPVNRSSFDVPAHPDNLNPRHVLSGIWQKGATKPRADDGFWYRFG